MISSLCGFRGLITVVLLFLMTGCGPLILFGGGTAAGVAGYKYYEGALTVIYQSPFAKTWDATLVALKEMNLRIENSEHGLTKGKISARRYDKTPVNITLEYKSANETKVDVRVGYLGDESASLAYKDKIRDVLLRN